MEVVRFFTTAGCHLCEQAWDLIEQVPLSSPVEVEVIDIAEDDALIEQYGVRIPVLEKNEKELGWPFTVNDIKQFIEG